jgi:hypothetical protein
MNFYLLLVSSFVGQAKSVTSVWSAQAMGWYMHQLAVHPVPVKSLSAGLVGLVGDAIAQYFLTGKGHRYHVRRGLALLVDGVVSGPFMHVAYEWMERIVPTKQEQEQQQQPSSSSPSSPLSADDDTSFSSSSSTSSSSSPWYSHVAAFIHVLADILILDSTFVALTILLTGVLEGIPYPILMDQFRNDYIGTLRASWITSMILFPLQFCMFRFLPLRLRVLAVNFLDVIWDAVLSFNAHRSRVFV